MRGFRAFRCPPFRSGLASPLASPRCASLSLAALLTLALGLPGCASAPTKPASEESFPLDPREGLTGPFEESVARGWRALEAGNAERARLEFAHATAAGPSRRAAAIGEIEALVLARRGEDAVPLCAEALSGAEPTLPLLTACGEAYARTGDPASAFGLYERAAARSPASRGVAQRSEQLRSAATSALLSAAERDAAAGRQWEARAKIAQAIVWNANSPEVLVRAAEVECAGGEKENALRYYRDALALGGVDEATQQRAGELALETGDYATAVLVFESLAARDPLLRDRAAEARLAFRIDNWPEAERQAARARRLTRSEAAVLVWWIFPEVRDARVRSGVVASDVLERKDSRVMMRAIALGLLNVDPETHRARPDAPLGRGAAAQMILRLVSVLGKPPASPECLSAATEAARSGFDAIRLATRCGLLSESGGAFVGGPEMTRGLDRLRSAFEEAASP